MMKKSFDVLSFVRLLLKKGKFFSGRSQKGIVRLKLLAIEYDPSGHPVLQLQWEGKNLIFKKPLVELLSRNKLWDVFPIQQVLEIIALKSSLSFQLHLISHFREDNTEKIVYKNNQNEIFIKEIKAFRKKELIKMFSPVDAHLLGYLLAWEDQKEDVLVAKNNEIKKKKH